MKNRIYNFQGIEHELSDEVYKILRDEHPCSDIGYGAGDLIRLIEYEGKLGGHFDPEYSTVCRVGATVAEFCGIRKDNLRCFTETSLPKQ